MTDHDDADDDGLKSLRAVWLSMPDEDPPDRGFAELMAAARVKADQMATPTLWERFTQLMRRPPVLALASVTVLLGGALLISQRGNDMEAQAPASRDEVAVGAQTPPPAPMEIATSSTVTAGSAAAESGDGKAETAEPKAPEPERKQQAEPVLERPAPKLAKKTAATRPAAKNKMDGDAFGAGGGGAPGGAKAGGTTSLLADEEAPVRKSPAKEEPAKTVQQEATATGAARPTVDATSAPDARPATPTVSQLHTQARAAAARGDCDAARTTTQRIAKQDAAYYKAKVAQDPALAACLRR